MADDDMIHRFQWQDGYGLIWHVGFYNHAVGFSAIAVSDNQRGTGAIYLRTHDIRSQKQPMAFLNDVRVDGRIENRGMGSMLVRAAIEECKRRGHKGLYGHFSEVDFDHFSKLKYFYEKLGFSVVFYGTRHPEYKYTRAGKIEMAFN